jgi:hypothetical protein
MLQLLVALRRDAAATLAVVLGAGAELRESIVVFGAKSLRYLGRHAIFCNCAVDEFERGGVRLDPGATFFFISQAVIRDGLSPNHSR